MTEVGLTVTGTMLALRPGVAKPDGSLTVIVVLAAVLPAMN